MIKWKIWTDTNIGGDLGAIMISESISESLKTNTTLTKLYLSGDEKWSKNEMNNNNNEENERMKEWNEEYEWWWKYKRER